MSRLPRLLDTLHAGGTWKGKGGETRGTARGRTPDTRACLACVLGGGQAGAVQYTVTHHKQPPLLAGSRQGLSACRVQSMDVGCGCDAGHTTHTQEAQRKKITAPCGGACGRRTSFPMPWRRVTWHLGRTHAEHCATTASTARGGRWTCKGSGATHSGSPEEDLLGDPRCSWAMNKRCYKPLEETPDRVDENLISRS